MRASWLHWFLVVGLVSLWAAAACATTSPAATRPGTATPALPDCATRSPVDSSVPAEFVPLLPVFTPDCPCDLENASVRIDECLVHASPDLVYPCSRAEEVREAVLGSNDGVRLIQRDHSVSVGCWHGTTSEERSLRLCNLDDGTSIIVAEGVRGDPVAAPGGGRWAYVKAGPELDGLAAHLFVVDLVDGVPMQLDTQPFPQASVVGAQILEWSDDGSWLEVSLWDGSADGHHRYRLSDDGQGAFELLP